jgi:hypothetical protein
LQIVIEIGDSSKNPAIGLLDEDDTAPRAAQCA